MNNEIYIKINGLNLTRIIDKLVENKVFVNNLIIKQKYVKFSIKKTDFCVFDKICKNEHKNYEIYYNSFLLRCLNKLKYLFGFILAFVICFCYIFSSSKYLYVVDISLYSNSAYDLNELNEYLKLNNIVVGARKSEINTKSLEEDILKEFNELSGCSVNIFGGNLVIDIHVSDTVFKEKLLYSKYDAVITEIDVYSGVCGFKVGDVVKVGDVLISDEVMASGKISGKVYYVGTEIYNEKQQKLIKTGNCYKDFNIKLFNKYLYKTQNNSNYSLYFEEKCDYCLTLNCFLPIIKEEVVFWETKLVEENIPFDVVEEDVMMKAYKQAVVCVGEFDNILDVSYSIVKDGCYTRVDCYIEVEKSLI